MPQIGTEDIQEAGFDKEKVKQYSVRQILKKTRFLQSRGVNLLCSSYYCLVHTERFLTVYPTQGLFKYQIQVRSGL